MAQANKQRNKIIWLMVPIVLLMTAAVVVIALLAPRELTSEDVAETQTPLAATAANVLDSLFDQPDETATLTEHQMTATQIVGLNMTLAVYLTQTQAAETPAPTRPAMATAEATP
ncbi:MAG: hypothetical protein H6670_01135 [Anaerolineaceae bacterium]|nr:hypothetical protein [Anaerolineae bacterium]MCB9458222.1 hypothetical protein [Anaerolineaceae bacterium]